MGTHRTGGARRAPRTRVRYGRIVVALLAVGTMVGALLGTVGLLPASLLPPEEAATSALDPTAYEVPAAPTATEPVDPEPPPPPAPAPAPDPTLDTALPAVSGEGHRVVFSEERQRVWLVDDAEQVRRTYLVSGSVYDNLDPGTFEVYSRSENATGIDDSGTMKYFVRFTRGDRAAIGFHDIPIHEGELVQTTAQLGTPLSHGCIRQERDDAIALWEFAPIGTTVVVTA